MVEKAEEQRQAMTRRLWMDYYNRYLLEKGIITQQEYHRMAQIIRQRYPKVGTTNRRGTA